MAADPTLALNRHLTDLSGRESHELLDRGGRRSRRLLGHGELGKVSQFFYFRIAIRMMNIRTVLVSFSMDIIDDDMIAQLMKSPVEEEVDSGVAFKFGGVEIGTPTPP